MVDTASQNDVTVSIKKKGKKRKISKHISDAKMKSSAISANLSGRINDTTDHDIKGNVAMIPPTPTLPNKKHKVSKEKQIKDPVDVEGYLLSWKQQQDQIANSVSTRSKGSTTWKFNKNTQSWLIRHLYDSSKINKSIFTVALQYFAKSNINVQQRLRHDAMQRAIQYQQNEKQQQAQEKETTQDNARNNDDDGSNDGEKLEEDLLEKNQRKEYKRARKILDTLFVPLELNTTTGSTTTTKE